MKCLQPCGPYYAPENDLCGLDEEHRGPCMPTDPVLKHGRACAHSGRLVGPPLSGDYVPLSARLCICDPYGDKARAKDALWQRYRRQNVLWQDKVWFTRDGDEVRVKDMDLTHLRNTIALIERGAARAKQNYEWGLAVNPGVQGEHALDAVDAILRDTMEADSLEWIRDTPLLKRLRKRERKLSARSAREDFADA